VIPATQNSATSSISHPAKHQDLNFKEQLHIGIRFFDIGVMLSRNGFVVSNILPSEIHLYKILEEFVAFVNSYPEEFVFLYIRSDPLFPWSPAEMLALSDIVTATLAGIILAPRDTDDKKLLSHLSLGDMRGNVIVLHDHDDHCFQTDAIYNEERQCQSWSLNKNFHIETVQVWNERTRKAAFDRVDAYCGVDSNDSLVEIDDGGQRVIRGIFIGDSNYLGRPESLELYTYLVTVLSRATRKSGV
jgi:hypothetical protein